RFHKIPTFGWSTIRCFSNNVSAMKKLAGRDFGVILQCSLPIFEGLLPEPHDKRIQDLLFALANWHACAKLRLHTESMLSHLHAATSYLGSQLRHFVKTTCPHFDTKELPCEEAARVRRRQKQGTTGANLSSLPGAHNRKSLNLSTFKLHALGDYATQIELFGTTDSFSTQTVSSLLYSAQHL
ncbi:hypothetical protein OE88DRAFT_1635916, partial [Heliocybe sulcata]